MVKYIKAKKLASVAAHHNEAQVSVFESWARVTGLHGVLDFHHANTPLLKIVWLLVICVGCFLAINQSSMLIYDYTYNSQWLTSVSYAPDKKGMISWPNFTLCNLNWLFDPTLKLANLSDMDIAYELGFEEGMRFYRRNQAHEADWAQIDATFDQQVEAMREKYLRRLATDSNLDGMSLVELRNWRLSQSCKDSIMRCGSSAKFDLEKENETCCKDAMATSQLGCFQVNPTATLKAEKPGYENGIYFILDAKAVSDYTRLTIGEKPSAGFAVELYFGNNEGDSMNPHIFIAPSTHTVISLMAEKRIVDVRRLLTVQYYTINEPCAREPKYKYLEYDSYSIKHCRDDCMARYFVESIGCTGQTAPLMNKTHRCRGEQVLEYDAFYGKITKNYNYSNIPLSPLQFNMTRCVSDCIEPCESVSVTATVSRAGFPAPKKAHSFQRYLEKAANGKDFENLTLLEIYFESSQYRVVSKMTRTTVDELISDIGGGLGVWTGISIISVFQAVVYIVYAVQRYCRPKQCQVPTAMLFPNGEQIPPPLPRPSIRNANDGTKVEEM